MAFRVRIGVYGLDVNKHLTEKFEQKRYSEKYCQKYDTLETNTA